MGWGDPPGASGPSAPAGATPPTAAPSWGDAPAGGAKAAGGGAAAKKANPYGGGIGGFFKEMAAETIVKPLALLGRPAEALQAAIGLSNRTGTDQGTLRNVSNALLHGQQFGIAGHGAVNTVENLGLDLVDPTILASGGTKAADFGSRLLVEGGAKDLAEKAATTGLSAAEKMAARDVIAEGIAKDGAGDLTKRTLMDKATGRYAGMGGNDLAAQRALDGLVKEGRGGLRIAGKTVVPASSFEAAGDLVRRAPGADMLDSAARSLVIPRSGVIKNIGKDEADILAMAQSKAAGDLETHIGSSVRPLQAETKINKITDADRTGPLLAALETGSPVEPRLQGALDELKAQRAAATQKLLDHQLLPPEFLHNADSYVPRVTTDEGFKAIAKATRKGQLPQELSQLFKVSGSLEARKILPDATIPEAEAVVQGMLGKAGITMKKGATFFEHDPVKAIVSHGAAVERASGQVGVLESLASVPGEPLVRFADTSTVKAPNLTDDIAAARSRMQTAKNRLSRTNGLLAGEGPARPRAGTTEGLETYTLDPVKRLEISQRQITQQNALASAQTDVANLMAQKEAGGHANAAADAARKAPEGFEAITVGERTAYVHPELAAEINKTKRLVDSDASIQRFTHHIDAVLNFWRSQNTVMPLGTGFFARNFEGNLLLNAVDNVGLRDYKAAMRIQRGVRRANKSGVEVESVLSKEDARIFHESETHNVYNQGAQEADLNHVAPADQVGAVKGKLSPLTGKLTTEDFPIIGTQRGPAHVGQELNAVIENNARLANFIANVRHSGDFAEAARRTRLTLFDYGDLTSAERAVGRRVVPFYCVPESVKALTRTGWKLHTDIMVGEELLTYNTDTGLSEWQPCREVAAFPHDEELLTFSNSRHRMSFTPNHRWPVRAHKNARKVVEGHHLDTTHSFVMAPALSAGGASTLTPDEARLLGWIATDGTVRRRSGGLEVGIYQSERKFLAEVQEVGGGIARKTGCFGRPGAKAKAQVWFVPVAQDRLAPLRALLSDPDYKDRLPAVVCGLSADAATAMRDAMYKADGTTKAGAQQYFAAQHAGVRDAFRILALFGGQRTGIPSAKGVYVSDFQYMKVAGASLEPDHYTGTVWCPRTDNGTWIAQFEDGTIVATGNTFARKSSGLLLRELIHDPAKINRIGNVMGAAEDITGVHVDSPLDAAGKTLATPITKGGVKAALFSGGYQGALKQQIVGTSIPDPTTGGFSTIDPNAPQSETRLGRAAGALLPEYGPYGRVNRTISRVMPGPNQDLKRLFLGLSDPAAPEVRTAGGAILPVIKPKTSKAKAPAAGKKAAGWGAAP